MRPITEPPWTSTQSISRIRRMLRIRLLAQLMFAALLACVIATPRTAHAQVGASISGTVRDAQGAVIPGVTVEAASPVLIEKARTAVTDATGRYAILDLRPGAYTVVFTLSGFTTVRRESVTLTGTGVTTVDAEMRVGAVQETITVTGEPPLVDLQSTRKQTVIDQEVVTAVPTSRNQFALAVLIPGISIATTGTAAPPNAGQDVGGAYGPSTMSLAAHGSRLADQRMTVNGVALSTMIGGGWGGGAVPNATGTAEFAIDTAAVDASLATGGPRINFIPKDGGNRLSATVFGSYATEAWQTESSRKVGAFEPIRANTVKVNGDFNPGLGGPFIRDRLWFYLSGRYQRADNYVPGMFYNANANNPNAFTYVPDRSRPAAAPREFSVYQGRMTWQATTKNKVGLTYDQETNCFCPNNVSATRSPEAGTDRRFPLQRFVQVDWNSPVSSKLLLEASAIHRVERWGDMHLRTGNAGNITSLDPRVVGIIDQGLGNFNYGAAAQGNGPGSAPFNNSWNTNLHYRAAFSYVTGSHVFKIGFNNAWGHMENLNYDTANPYFYTFTVGVPTAITQRATPFTVQVDVDRDLGFFAQDRWTVNRWTLSGGVRFDQFKNSFPSQDLGPSLYFPARNVHFDRIDNINWKDVTPKLGASYDVFGTGKTALKVTLNKYLLGYGTLGLFENSLSSAPSPINNLVNNTTRTWDDANRNFTPDCDLALGTANGECGARQNPNFGSLVPGEAFDPALLTGWGKRQYNWEFSAGVQHELLPRVSLDLSYFRRIYGNFQIQLDRAVTAASYDTFTFTVPNDPRLPAAGKTLTAFDLNPAVAFAAPSVFRTLADDQDVKVTDHWNGIDITVNTRMRNGLVLQGGVSTGRAVVDNCDLLAKYPENSQQFLGSLTRLFFFAATPLEYCKRTESFATQAKALGAYTIQKIGVQVSGTFQSVPGALLEANYNLFSGASTLGRGFSLGPFRTVNLVEPGSLRMERINQVDARVSKIFRLRNTRTNVNFDVYNVFNANTITGENFAYDVWRQPQYILPSRFFKVSAQFDF